MVFINFYINFNGNVEEVFNFYKLVFGGEFVWIVCFKDMGNMGNVEFLFVDYEVDKIMYIVLLIGFNVLMGNDVFEFMGCINERENCFKIFIGVISCEEVDRLYNGFLVGGEVEMLIGDSLWGFYFVMFCDKYGIEWMIDYDENYKGKV